MTNNETSVPVTDAETAQMIAEARRDFGNPTMEVIQVASQPSKVEIAKNASQVIYGTDNIGVLQKREGWLIDDGIVFDNKTCTLKSLPNGDFLVNNFSTWDLVLLDQNLVEKGKLRGGYSSEPMNYRQLHTRNSEDDNFILWMSHPDHLSIVRTSNLSSNEIRNFWKFDGNRVIPIACAISPSGRKLVGISKLGSIHVFHYYEGSDQVVMYKQDDIHQRCTEWESLEISYDQDACLLGGSDGRGTAYVIALTLNDEASLITERTIPNARSITSLRRHNQGDVYFAGGYRSINILFYNKKQLHILRDINITLDVIIRDLSFNPTTQELYGATGTDKIVLVDFSNPGSRPQKSSMRPMPIQRTRKRLGDGMSRSPSQNSLMRPVQTEAVTSSAIYPAPVSRIEPKYSLQFNEFAIRQLNLPNSSPLLPSKSS